MEGFVTESGQKMLIDKCVECDRKKSSTVFDINIAVECLDEMFKTHEVVPIKLVKC